MAPTKSRHLLAFLPFAIITAATAIAAAPAPKFIPPQNHGAISDDTDADSSSAGGGSGGDADGADDAPGDHDAVCRNYLKSFLKGSTDARDDCEGLLNAYGAADCQAEEDGNPADFQRWWRWWWGRIFGDGDSDGGGDDDDRRGGGGNSTDDDDMAQIDDFYEQFRCCDTIHSYYVVHCRSPRIQSKFVLSVVTVLILCGLVKTVIRTFRVGWIPEAGGCILVGAVFGGALAAAYPDLDFERHFSFDDEMFMCLLLPPIVFQAALSIDKKAFRLHLVPIAVFAIVGTVLSALLTGWLVHALTSACSLLTSIPLYDSLVFGSLISSVDPVATLSILSSVGVSETDALYVLVFGESLLNDGAAIVLFRSLVGHLDRTADSPDGSIIWETVQKFVAVSTGSATIGLLCGVLCAIYFWSLRNKQPPVLEVSTFFCWALVPYYVADAAGWSGIVAILAFGFFADAFVVGARSPVHSAPAVALNEDVQDADSSLDGTLDQSNGDCSRDQDGLHLIISGNSHLSALAKSHIDFVSEVLASVMETAVFAYLGMFLFAERQLRNAPLNLTAILACVGSRLATVVMLSWAMNVLGGPVAQRCSTCHRPSDSDGVSVQRCHPPIDSSTQLILLLSGMRGAVSVALAENIPLYNAVTKRGSEVKLEIKAMTSSSIIFTVFIFGALTYFLLEKRGRLSPAHEQSPDVGVGDGNNDEQTQEPLLAQTDSENDAQSSCGEVSAEPSGSP